MKTVIEMAREAGIVGNFWPELERFAELVRADAIAKEREAMMQLFTDPENQPTQHGTVTVNYMQREIATEREACAKVCEETEKIKRWDDYIDGCQDCASAIRARGNT